MQWMFVKKDNDRLEEENRILQNELEETKRKLAEAKDVILPGCNMIIILQQHLIKMN